MTTATDTFEKNGVIVKVWPAREGYDSADVSFFDPKTDEQVGSGYKALDDGSIKIMRCPMPKCRRENYAMAVSSGTCAWCAISFND